MNKKIFLALILIFTLLFSTFSTITEGACSYEDGGSISSSSSLAGKNEAPVVGRSKNSCQTAGIYKNSRSLSDVTKKLNELTNLADKVENSVKGNQSGVKKNAENAKKINSLTDDSVEAEGNDDMCKDYPESCKKTKLPKRISKNDFNKQMARG
tara:strand:+ start:119 stop:580 length:462 start_codon:yes stop_codon:yes gene_type:complete